MNPTEIYDALAEIAAKPFDPNEFPFAFAEATDAAKAAISKLRNGSTNKSDLPGGVLFNKKFHYAPALKGLTDVTLDQLRASKKTKASKPAILIASDGETIAAEHPASGDTLHCTFSELGDHFGFFLPAAGKERYRAVEENPVDVKATGKLARLYDALTKANPDWGSDERRHEMNQLMMRLIFCMFAEDVGIFPDNQFSRLLFTHAGDKGEEARETIIAAFNAMNLPKDKRGSLPAWTAELEYVNGGLFAGTIDAPRFDTISFRYLRDACDLDWREINPDIFGSMIQSVADPKQRSELGMHYTSVPNIMKVIGPLFLDDLDAEIHKAWDRAKALQQVLDRMSRIRVFDPACGSGNFLVVSYRELRARETRILQRLEELNGPGSMQMFSAIPISNFYGIEIADFAAETAKLALFIAEYQANASFAEVFGRRPAALPLKDAAHIRTGNSLRENWDEVCPPPAEGEEVFIAGNPPFLGSTYQSKEQKADLAFVFAEHIKSFAAFDFVAAWFFKASRYIRGYSARAALVSTNSICQGYSVAALWPHVLGSNLEIGFAHKDFKWRNNASANAAVICSIIGIRNQSKEPKRLFADNLESSADNINGYLVNAPTVAVEGTRNGLFGLPSMEYGNKPVEGGYLLFTAEEKDALLEQEPRTRDFFRPFMGSKEVVNGYRRYCLWITPQTLDEAKSIPAIASRIERVAEFRAGSTDAYVREKLLPLSYRFKQVFEAKSHSILVPSVTSERRPYLPVERVGADVIASNLNQVLYDAPEWCIALIASRLHLVWIATVCGKLKSDFRYSNTLGWNTFPVPKFSEDQLAELSASARRILKCRYSHFPKTIAELYDPDKMPDDLRAVHRENDDLLETMYIGRPFRNDTERLEKLFKLYAAKVKSQDKKGARA
ncbi:Type II restriction/modification system, DNA methylase subunit YeeA [Pseudooceanicola antarcticus]|uniref:site-specific DNA-methyltransferase (adenine-specific) n=1 Tax=Pseudooceanicola antarcticus TaxID=1247613 RepID=A0A285JL57_9RHOB|nr:DNA methyltransferase [Pseudooceanicola antarcticus]PJE32863.1 class I SAM-dependent DNA methyltransferase [Pseudooceanicola antarcticus]SNY59841.1 Type II restriction/modification system, DNA methylase subunit YeeA [Pseudooceanicola antarcticus]